MLAAAAAVAAPAAAAPSTEEINAAALDDGSLPEGQSAITVKLQVLLDRIGASPGVIDGYRGENVVKTLNPDADFGAAGTVIAVADTGSDVEGSAAKIEADQSLPQMRALDAGGRLLAAYPATIGSAATPSPSGTHTVTGIALDPTYSYRPDENFQQGGNTEPLTLPPGPNGPVGLVWIDLSEPTYGLHGAPEPAEIDKTQSHGCVRLTNWDARELAALVAQGTPVAFLD
jgi:lipoprotein-anchoring transpeptidase ErfK/SrfK